MSIQQLSRVLANARNVSAGEWKLLLFLANYANKYGVQCFPSDRLLLEHTGWTARYLRLVKRRLLDRRWIVKRTPGGGRGRIARYQLRIPLQGVCGQLALMRAAGQLALPFAPAEILWKRCGNAADEETETRIIRSATADRLIRQPRAAATITARAVSSSTETRIADPLIDPSRTTTYREEGAPTRADRKLR